MLCKKPTKVNGDGDIEMDGNIETQKQGDME
jgi:hypothetical protein